MSILHVRAQTAIICSRSQSQSEVEAMCKPRTSAEAHALSRSTKPARALTDTGICGGCMSWRSSNSSLFAQPVIFPVL